MTFMTPTGLLASCHRYNEIIRDVAGSTGAVLIDIENEIPGDARHFADSVHFTDPGSQAMAARVFRTLSQHPATRLLLEPSASSALRIDGTH